MHGLMREGRREPVLYIYPFFFFMNAPLDGSQHRLTDGLGKLNWFEVACRVQIVVSRLIDHTKLSMFRGVGVRKYLIDFPRLQGNLVALVLQANNKFCG